MMSLVNCTDTSDCNVQKKNGKIVEKYCFSEMFGRSETFFCDCNSLTGLTGDSCNTRSIQSSIFLMLHALQLVLSLAGIFYSLYLIGITQRIEKHRSGQKKTLNIIFSVLVFTLLSFLCGLIGTISNIKTVLDPESLQLIRVGQEGVLISGLDRAGLLLGTVPGIYFFAYANMLIVLSWLNVTRNANIAFSLAISQRVYRIQQTVCFTLIAFTLLGVIFGCLYDFELISVTGGLLLLFMVVFTFVGRLEFLRTFKNLRESHLRKKTLLKINEFSLILCICLSIMGMLFALFTLISGQMLKYPPGSINWYFNALILVYIFKNALLFYSSYFLQGFLGNIGSQKS